MAQLRQRHTCNYDLKVVGRPLQNSERNERVEEVFRIMKEIGEGVPLQKQGGLLFPVVASEVGVLSAPRIQGFKPILVPTRESRFLPF